MILSLETGPEMRDEAVTVLLVPPVSACRVTSRAQMRAPISLPACWFVSVSTVHAILPDYGRAWAWSCGAYWPGGHEARRSFLRAAAQDRPRTPTVISSSPAASVASHGAGPGAARGAIPPKPVAAPPIGACELPAASVRVSTLSPEAVSSTTM